MKTAFLFLALGALWLVIPSRTAACTPKSNPEDTYSVSRLTEAFDQSSMVVVAKVLSVTQTSMPTDGERTEDAWLVVQESLKGPHVVGEMIHVRSRLISGPCGLNMRNDPPWIFEFDESEGERPASISDVWLIYGEGNQPYDITGSYSSPMDLLGSEQLEVHRKRVQNGEVDHGT